VRSLRPLFVALTATGFGVILALAGLTVLAPKSPVVVLSVPERASPTSPSLPMPASVSPTASAVASASAAPSASSLAPTPSHGAPHPLDIQRKLP
jgi:hypothetical protein